MNKTLIFAILLLLTLPLAGCMKKAVKPGQTPLPSQSQIDTDASPDNVSRTFSTGGNGKGINLVSSARNLYSGILKTFGKIGKNGKPVELKKNDLITAMIIGGIALIALLVFVQNRPKKYIAHKGKYQS